MTLCDRKIVCPVVVSVIKTGMSTAINQGTRVNDLLSTMSEPCNDRYLRHLADK